MLTLAEIQMYFSCNKVTLVYRLSSFIDYPRLLITFISDDNLVCTRMKYSPDLVNCGHSCVRHLVSGQREFSETRLHFEITNIVELDLFLMGEGFILLTRGYRFMGGVQPLRTP